MNDAAAWDRLAEHWTESDPPTAPSPQDLETFRRHLVGHLRGRRPDESTTVVLGATVGLRRLFVADPVLAGCRLCCVDWSRPMYERINAVTGFANPLEDFVHADWLDFDLGSESIACVLGDKVLDNLAIELWPGLVASVWRHLRPGGLWLLRVGLVAEAYREWDFDRFVRRWSVRFRENEVSLEDAVDGLWRDSLLGSAFVEGGPPRVMSVGQFKPQIDRLADAYANGPENPARSTLLSRFVRTFESSFDLEWTACTMEAVRRSMDGRFEIDGVDYSSDYEEAPRHPIFACRRR